jgi:hypothetical protein
MLVPPKKYQISIRYEALLGPVGISENLTVVELVSQFLFFRARSLITVFTRGRPRILF